MPTGESRTELLIVGMKDNSCREIVAEALEIVHGVRDVQVNLYRGHAIVRHEPHCQRADLVAAVARAGYGAALARGVMDRLTPCTSQEPRRTPQDNHMREGDRGDDNQKEAPS